MSCLICDEENFEVKSYLITYLRSKIIRLSSRSQNIEFGEFACTMWVRTGLDWTSGSGDIAAGPCQRRCVMIDGNLEDDRYKIRPHAHSKMTKHL